MDLKEEDSYRARARDGKPSPRDLIVFPPPHRLGQSYGIKRLRVSDFGKAFSVATTPVTTTTSTPESQQLSQDSYLEETDYYSPPPKKQKIQPSKSSKSSKLSKPVAETFDDAPIKIFSLFLPSELPASIPQCTSALQELVFLTTETYLRLWKMAPQMDCVEVRLPPLYTTLSSNETFLRELVSTLFHQLDNVRSIADLYVPKIELYSTTNLSEILHSILEGPRVSHLYLPMKCSLDSKGIQDYDLKSFALFLHKTKLKEITLVSTDLIISELSDKLAKEVNAVRNSTLEVAYSNEDLGAPGPAFISNSEGEDDLGEIVDPCVLVRGINASEKPKEKTRSTKNVKSIKSRARVAFSSDCTYFDEAQLSTDGSFTSKIWNMERLHEEGIDGSGMTIAIIDSGINYTHSAFKNRIVAIKNFVSDETDNIDCIIDSDGHGTHCAGIAAGSQFYCPTSSDPNSECILVPPGVAPGAKLVICKVVKTSNGDVDSKAFLDALKWLKEIHTRSSNRIKIDVVSISLASTYYNHQRAQIISDLISLGMIVVCCASNVGRLRLQPIAFPARLGHVLCIGAHDENGKPTSFSPVGRELDFLSPGDNLWGPGPGTKGPFAMDCASGTSCATPGVAGLVCLILQAVAKICDRHLQEFVIGGRPLIDLVHNVWVMRELLKEISSSPGHHSDEIGHGTLNIYRLLDRSDEEVMRIINEIIEDE